MTAVITIDGPSGAGKGTTSALLAQKLGYHLLDSGALYRLTALAATLAGVEHDDEPALAQLAAELDVVFETVDGGVKVVLAGSDVSLDIRTEVAGMGASKVAALVSVRAALLQRQRDFVLPPGLVADGRDMGTTVFPAAGLKIFLIASADERARRRMLQLQQKGQVADYQEVLAAIEQRDKQDRERSSSPLKPAEDAHIIDSSDMTIEQVLQVILQLAQA